MPLSAAQRAERKRKETERNLSAITRVVAGLQKLDRARDDLVSAADQLYRQVHSIETPDAVIDDYERFVCAGGVTAEHYVAWLNGKLPKNRVPQRKHLRLVFSQKKRTSAIQLWWQGLRESDGEPPEAA
jgi:hypothetical protein